jgi:hypothetical protein
LWLYLLLRNCQISRFLSHRGVMLGHGLHDAGLRLHLLGVALDHCRLLLGLGFRALGLCAELLSLNLR